MAAGLGFKTFTTGEVLTAADTNGYLMQGVLVFASAAARDAAITSPQEGQCCYLKDTDAVLTYSGAAWVGFDDSNAIQNTIVDAKGDIVAASGSDTPARLAVGNNGETLVADSSQTTGLAYREDYAAGKNAIINGAFNVWQRGTSFTVTTTKTYTADRFASEISGTGVTRTVSQQTFTPGAAPVAGYESQYFLRYNRSVAGTSPADYLTYRIEDARTFAGQTVTISYWAKAASAMTLGDIIFYQEFGSGGSATSTTATGSQAITTSWVRYTKTVAIPSVSGKTIGTGSALAIYFVLPTSGTFTFDIWGVQVEDGSVATAFNTATGTIQGELAACQRYYYRLTATAASASIAQGWATSSISGRQFTFLPVEMRVSPTSLDFSTLDISDNANAAIDVTTATLNTQTSTRVGVITADVASGATANRPYGLRLKTISTSHLGFSAEL